MQQQGILSIRGLSVSYGSFVALKDINLDFAPGRIYALVGENGAGKSTLIRTCGGYINPSDGSVFIDGVPWPKGSVRLCEESGISIVHQESSAFLHLSAEENVFVGREPTVAFGTAIDRKVMVERTRKLLEDLGSRCPLGVPLRDLPLAQRQLVAIARALSFDSKILILDEPSASLSRHETEKLFAILRQLRDQGVCVILVSHRLEEVRTMADEVFVLRDGQLTGHFLAGQYTNNELIKSMTGRTLTEQRTEPWSGVNTALLRVESLSRVNEYDSVSFEIKPGEIVGLGGLLGAGRSEVALSLMGLTRPDSGRVQIEGQAVNLDSVAKSISLRLALVPEDRQSQGLVVEQSIVQNIVASIRQRLANFGWINNSEERRKAQNLVENLGIKTPHIDADCSSLSGGNQQKVVLGRAVSSDPKILILDEPTRGVDIGSKLQIHESIRDMAKSGMGILLISSDLPELIALSHRIVVMKNGRIEGEVTYEEMSEEKVLQLAFGREVKE